MLSEDAWPGAPKKPMSYNAWLYAYGNPVLYTDASGNQSVIDPNCDLWPGYPMGYGSLGDLCRQADWDDNQTGRNLGSSVPEDVLDAREAIYRSIILGAQGLSVTDEGYKYVAMVFSQFLDGGGNDQSIELSASSGFANDPGIARATRFTHIAPSNPADEATTVVPLGARFMQKHVLPVARTSGTSVFRVGPTLLLGEDNYRNPIDKIKLGIGLEPRARSTSWWAAFGHVTINGTFSAKGMFSCALDGYVVQYDARYDISDYYQWFEYKSTPAPFPFSGRAGGLGPMVPHLWAISLRDANPARAHQYTNHITWTESGRLFTTDFRHLVFPFDVIVPDVPF